MDKLSYTDRLVKLELITLELRRLHNDLVMCYKIVFGLLDLQFSAFFSFSPSEATRGHQYKLYKPRGDGARNSFFCNRIINVWNKLPTNVVDFTSLCTFKRTIKLVNFSAELKASMS